MAELKCVMQERQVNVTYLVSPFLGSEEKKRYSSPSRAWHKRMLRKKILLRHNMAAARVILLQRKREHKHDGRPNSEDHERIDIGCAAGLGLHGLINFGIGRHVRALLVQPGLGQALRESGDGSLKERVFGSGMTDQNLLMKLRAARQERGYQGGSDAAADITHEVYHSRDGIIFFGGNSNVGRQGDGYEKETHAKNLRDAQPHRGAEGDLQIKLPSGI